MLLPEGISAALVELTAGVSDRAGVVAGAVARGVPPDAPAGPVPEFVEPAPLPVDAVRPDTGPGADEPPEAV
ncbi:hypothetical protein PV330_39680 [Streptomyces caniscabiei]|uniref:hypothetical protein n=1 Tax=Streptomyces caniscabiei TaxID=2746961 RepID=UPI0029AE826F|nr:hypothetical protein [Streptomyces caniscabiei]MDX2606114.1 hypothetical protein [Streptomyces caniscabiei]MDX2739777.1 hypothetical protein [Streptomyces caniscabiei]